METPTSPVLTSLTVSSFDSCYSVHSVPQANNGEKERASQRRSKSFVSYHAIAYKKIKLRQQDDHVNERLETWRTLVPFQQLSTFRRSSPAAVPRTSVDTNCLVMNFWNTGNPALNHPRFSRNSGDSAMHPGKRALTTIPPDENRLSISLIIRTLHTFESLYACDMNVAAGGQVNQHQGLGLVEFHVRGQSIV